MTLVMEVEDKDLKADIVNILYMFNKLEKWN